MVAHDPKILIEWIKAGLKKPGKSKGGLAAALNREASAVSQILNGKRKIAARELPLIADYLDDSIPAAAVQIRRQVPIIGYVGASPLGAALFAGGQGPFGDADAPEGSSDQTVAVEVRGTSLGSIFESWLIFYDEVRDPPDSTLLRKLCVCGLIDGETVLVKKLARGSRPGLWSLLSNNEEPIYDVELAWAAPVKAMTPR